MADENIRLPGGADEPAGNGQGPAVALQTVYIKDLSFESPKGPFLPAQAQDPKMSLISAPRRARSARTPTRSC